MPDLRWDDVKHWFDTDVHGELPDGHVPDTGIEDWQAVLDLVRDAGWRHEYEVDRDEFPLPDDAGLVVGIEGAVLKVWPVPGIQVNFWPFDAEQIDFDIDARQITGQERLDDLCDFLRAIGSRLGKPVVLTPEGVPTLRLFAYDPGTDRVVDLTRDQ